MKDILFLLAVVIWLVHCDVVNSAPPPREQVIFITASWCGPCQVFKKYEVPKLKKDKLSVSRDQDSDIRIVDWDKDKQILFQYSLKDIKSIPQFIYIKDNKEVDRLEFDIASAKQVKEFYERNKREPDK